MALKEPKRYTVTAALPYANGPLHIGHISGVYLPADVYARYMRSSGRDILFVCGSDEHGAAITIRAKKDKISPTEIVDKYHAILEQGMKDLGISFDIYHRTSSELHHETAAEYFKDLEAKGVFEVRESEQYFDESEQQFLADRYITGTCPRCEHPKAYGDQCENCGSALSPTDLINPKSTLSGNKPVLRPTSHWYLPMQDHQEWLEKWLNEGLLNGQPHHDTKGWKDHVLGQCRSWLEAGLQPRAMTRDLDWGVKVPLEGADGKVLYVWLDAPIGYISATKQWAKDNGKDWKTWWQDEDSQLVHFLGKDNIVFHCIIFPILLKAHGDYILPSNVPANAFMNLEGEKMSTSNNYAVWWHEYHQEIPGREDEMRYTLTSLSPENRDSDFKWAIWQEKINNELVKNYGNFVNRTLVLTYKNFDGKVPEPGVLTAEDEAFLAKVGEYPAKVGALIEKYQIREAQAEMMMIADAGDKYLSQFEPWKLLKGSEDDKLRAATILYVSVQATATLAAVSAPFLPFTSERLFGYLNLDALSWQDAAGASLVSVGHVIEKPAHLFKQVDDKVVAAQVEKLEESKRARRSNPDAPEVKSSISFDEFKKLDIRVGVITKAKKVKGADSLLELEVDTGVDTRTVVSGIAEQYLPGEIVGMKVSIVVNLKPAKIRGVLSQGMILMAEDADKKLTFVQPEKDFLPGSEIR